MLRIVMSLARYRRLSALFVAIVILAPCLTGVAQQIDLSHVPQRAIGAVVLHPQQLAKSPELELVPWEVFQAAIQQEMGFDPLDIEQVLALVAAPTGAAPPDWGGVIRFSQPPQLAGKLIENTEEASAGGVTYRRAPGPGMPCFCLVDGSTLLVGSEPMLQDMINAGDQSSPLREMLAKIPSGNDLVALLAFDPLRDLVKGALAQAPPLPPPLQPLLNVPDQLDAVTVIVNLNRERLSGIKLTATDADAADELNTALRQGLDFAKQMLMAQVMQEMAGGDDPIEQATARYLTRLADTMEARLQPRRSGNDLVITLSADYASTGVMVALLLPAIQAAREAARRTGSANNLKQIGLAMHNFHDVYGKFPPAAKVDADGKPLLSWRVHILPFVEAQDLYEKFHLDEPWDSEHNRPLIEQMPIAYQNPNLPASEGKTNYLAVTGPGTAFAKKDGTRIRDFTDGTSNSILVVEANADRAVIWTKPDDLTFDPQQPLAGLGGLRPGGFQALLADGSVQFVANTIDPDVLRALMTIAGGEPIPRGGF
jgi:hypothetical protein